MADKKVAIRQVEVGDDGQLHTVYIDKKTKKRITNLKNYRILNDNPTESVETPTKGNTKGFAVPLLVRGEDGLNKTVYVDPKTGNEVTDLSKVNVLDQYSSNRDELGLSPREEVKKPTTKAQEKSTSKGGRDWSNQREVVYDTKPNTSKAIDDYGYINKPGIMKLTNFLPGPLGTASKLANTAINASNTAAVDKARDTLGLKQMSPLGAAKGILSDQKGYIGDVTYGDATSPVGFEASTKDGRTTLTPREALLRQQSVGLKEATPEEKKENIAGFKKENPRGLIARVFNIQKEAERGKPTPVQDQQAYTAPTVGSEQQQYSPDTDLEDRSRAVSGVNVNLQGKGRSELPSSDIVGKVQDVVTDTLGPGYTVNLNSGMEPEGADPVGTKHRHPEGFAGDFTITDPTGRTLSLKSDSSAIKAVAVNAAGRYGTNFGMGPEYMGQQTMHVDQMDLNQYPGAAQWGSTAKGWSSELDKARADGVMDPSYYDVQAPTPTFRDQLEPGVQTNLNGYASVDLGRPTSFDTDTRNMMAATLAGEIDLRNTDLTTPEGIREADAIMSTMENRAGTYGSVANAITAPKQYSTWNNEQAAGTAMANLEANPSLYRGLVDNYVTDPSKNLGFTSYYNPSIANPGWGDTMSSSEKIGPHQFGKLDDYTPASFGNNFGRYGMTKDTETKRQGIPSFQGTAAKAQASVDLSIPKAQSSQASNGFSGSVSDENANRSNSTQTKSNGYSSSYNDRNSSGNTPKSESVKSGTSGTWGGDRVSSGKSSYDGNGMSSGQSTGRSPSGDNISKSPGSTGGFGVGGDRSSAGKSTTSYGGGFSASGKGTASSGTGGKTSGTSSGSYSGSRSDGWT